MKIGEILDNFLLAAGLFRSHSVEFISIGFDLGALLSRKIFHGLIGEQYAIAWKVF